VAQEKSYTPDEVAELLQISKYTVYEMVKRGDLSAYRIGRKLRFQKSDIEEYIKKAKGMDNVYKGVVVSRNGEKFFETGAVAISLITDVEGECRIMIEPDDIILAKDIVKSSARNVLRGQVENVEDCGPVYKIVAQEKSYTPDEVAELLQISKYTVYEMVKRGDLSAYRIGRKLRFQKSDIEEYIKKAKGMDNVYKGVVVSKNGEKIFETGTVAISLVTDSEGECQVTIEPDDIILAKDIVKSSARNVLRGQVENVEDCGPVYKIRLNVGVPLYAVITRQSYLDMEIALGDSLYAIFKSTSVRVL